MREQVQGVEQRIAIAKLELRNMHGEEMDINALLAYAYDFIRTVENTWYEALPEHKIKLQRFIFPDGVIYEIEGFSNPRISPLFNLISTLGANDSTLVTPNRIELLLAG